MGSGDYDLRWILLTLASYPVFLLLYAKTLVSPARRCWRYPVGMILLCLLLLRWYPDAVDVSGDGNTALSRGPYWMDNPAAPAGKRYRIGRFISTWVRGGDGQWQVVFDGGGGNVPKPATQAEVEALAAARKACPYR